MIYDVSVPLRNDMPVWPTDPPLQLSSLEHLSRDKTHTVRVTNITMGSLLGRGSGESIQLKFAGEGWVVVQPYEEVYMQRAG